MEWNAQNRKSQRPTIIAIAALVSVFWLLCCGIGVKGGSPKGGRESYERYLEAKAEANATWERVGISKDTQAMIGVFIYGLSLLSSLALTVTSFCFWNQHKMNDRVITIIAGVLFLPVIFCGVVY
jgi:hypothetical protein